VVLTQPPCPSSVLAFATTVHFGLAALRSHRRPTSGGGNPLALVSLLLAAAPWVWPSVPGVALGFALHLAWFATCEAMVASQAALARPAAAPTGPSAVPVATSRAPARVAQAVAAPPQERFVQVPVLATFDETDDMRTFRLARPEGFAFEAGQFVTVRVRVDGKDCVRCYSISSAPDVRGYFEITVKRQGVVSNALHATARPGAQLFVRRPNGRFVYPSGDDRPIVLLAGGVGVTPLMSMLRHAVQTEPARPITLLYSAHTARGFAFEDELASIALRHPQARVIFTATRDPAPPAPVRAGRIDEAALRSAVPDVEHSVAFICGPAPMIAGMKALLTAVGVPPAQVRHEVFEAATAVSTAPSRQRPAPAAAAAADYPMRCAASARTVTVRPGETLLDAAERGGVPVDSLCRAGVCGTCRTRVAEGEVECPSTTLDPRERAEGFVLACVATVHSPCTVDL